MAAQNHVTHLQRGSCDLVRDIDGKFRAYNLTQSARHTRLRIRNLRGVIALGIERSRHAQHMTRAISLAQSTAFAASGDDGNLPAGNDDLIVIQRRPPKFQVTPPQDKL